MFNVINNLRIRSKLLLSFGFIVFMLIASSAVTFYEVNQIRHDVNEIDTELLPITQGLFHLGRDLNASMDSLRGYVLSSNDFYKTERQHVWDEIDIRISDLDALSHGWDDQESIDAFARIKSDFNALKEAQYRIETLAKTHDRFPANKMLNEEASPLGREQFQLITSLIDAELEMPATPERKALLGMMADIRGSLGASLATSRAYLLTGQASDKAAFERAWAKNTRRFNDLSGQQWQLSEAQKKDFEAFSEARSSYDALPAKMFAIREGEDWDQAQSILASEAEPIAERLREGLFGKRNEDFVRDGGLVEHENQLLAKDIKHANEQSALLVKAIAGFAVIGVLISIGSIAFINASVTRRILWMKESVQKLSDGDVQETIPCADAKDEIGDMARALSEFREEAIQAFRAKNGMENASANIMMADEDFNIVFMNESQEKMLRAAEADLKAVLPSFDVNNLMGQNIDIFHKNPAHQRKLLGGLTSSYSTRIEVAGRTFDLFANPSFSKAGQRIGTSIEWVDRTAELRVASEIKEIIAAASKGDLESRIDLEGKEDFFLEVSEGVNNLAGVMQNVASDLAKNLKALAGGDLTARIETEYEGIFLQLKDDYNMTSEKLAEIVGTIKGICVDVKDNSDEMADSSSGLANRAEQQASTLEETAASMEELTSTVKTNADNARDANDAAVKTRSIAEEGSRVANDAGQAMEKINESSQQITNIINVIDEIAFQTNLLALNAAVEAARAGDAGRGFAVVAQEVRTLAQRSAQSSKDIKSLIDDSSKQVGSGVELVQTAVGSLQQIYDAIDGVADTIGQMATASAEQATSLDELNQAVMEMDSMTQQNASMAQQSRSVAQIMQEKSDDLADMVAFFKIDGSEAHVRRDRSSKPRPSVDQRPANQSQPNGALENGSAMAAVANGSYAESLDDDAEWKEF
jgi:methyl-accepting chemotaxis protein